MLQKYVCTYEMGVYIFFIVDCLNLELIDSNIKDIDQRVYTEDNVI